MAMGSDLVRAAREAAREAGGMLREALRRRRPEVSYKGPVDLVTPQDRRAQEIVHERLAREFPGVGFLAEEGLAVAAESGERWVVDPLDGTTNYAHTFPVYSVSIALQRAGAIVAGVVYDPSRDEMFWAEDGRGAFLDGERIRVSEVDALERALLTTGFPYDIRTSPLNNMDHWNNFLLRAQAVRRVGSAALDLAYVACGRFDGFWELKLKPWDVAAGSLIVREAGGRVTDFSGGPFRIDHPEALASNGLIHAAMMDVLRLGRTAGRPG